MVLFNLPFHFLFHLILEFKILIFFEGDIQSDKIPVHQTILRPKAHISSNSSSNTSSEASEKKTKSSEIDNLTTHDESDMNSNARASNHKGSRKNFIKSLETKIESVGTQFSVDFKENTDPTNPKMKFDGSSDITDRLNNPSDSKKGLDNLSAITDGLNNPLDSKKGLDNPSAITEGLNDPEDLKEELDDPSGYTTVLNDISEPLDTEDTEDESQNQLEILYTKNNER